MLTSVNERLGTVFRKPVRLFVGYSFIQAWNTLLYSSGVLVIDAGNLLPLQLIHITSSISVVVTTALAALFATRLSPLSDKREFLYITSAFAVLATAGIVMVSSGLLSPLWIHLCIAVTAATGMILQIAWLEHLATQGIRGALVCLGITTVLGTFIQLFITYIPSEAGIPLTCLLPVIGLVTLRPFEDDCKFSYRDEAGTLVPDRPHVRDMFRQSPVALLSATGIVFLSMGVIRTLHLPVNPTIVTFSGSMLYLIGSLLTIFIALSIAFYSYRMNMAIAFYIAIPFIMVASLMVAAPTSLPMVVPQTAVNTGTELVRLLVFMLLIDLSTSKRIPSVFLFSLLTCFQFAGTSIGQLIAVALGGDPMLVSLVMMVALVIAMLVLVAARDTLKTSGDDGTDRDSESRTGPSHPMQRSIGDLTERYGLSPRQREVLEIWISGHNSAYIEERLHISKNTVKTHLNHIYAKTGTTNREELLQLLENIETGDSTAG